MGINLRKTFPNPLLLALPPALISSACPGVPLKPYLDSTFATVATCLCVHCTHFASSKVLMMMIGFRQITASFCLLSCSLTFFLVDVFWEVLRCDTKISAP